MERGCFMFEFDCVILDSPGVDLFQCILVGEEDAHVMRPLVTLVN